MFKYLNTSVAISASGLSVHASSLSLFEKKTEESAGIACHFRQYSSRIISKILFLTTFVSPNITVVQTILTVSLSDTRRFIVMYNICLAHTAGGIHTAESSLTARRDDCLLDCTKLRVNSVTSLELGRGLWSDFYCRCHRWEKNKSVSILPLLLLADLLSVLTRLLYLHSLYMETLFFGTMAVHNGYFQILGLLRFKLLD